MITACNIDEKQDGVCEIRPLPLRRFKKSRNITSFVLFQVQQRFIFWIIMETSESDQPVDINKSTEGSQAESLAKCLASLYQPSLEESEDHIEELL